MVSAACRHDHKRPEGRTGDVQVMVRGAPALTHWI